MVQTVQEKKVFFVLMSLFAIAGGVYIGLSDKTEAIYFFSENRSTFLDAFFKVVTKLGEEPLYFVFGIGALFVKPKYAIPIAMTGLAVMLFSYGLKTMFAEERPFTHFDRQNLLGSINLVDGVELLVGPTSFPSGHAMSAFALYSLLVLLLPTSRAVSVACFLIALLVGVSRVYLVQHFWQDVYAGGLIGIVLSMTVFHVFKKYAGNGVPV